MLEPEQRPATPAAALAELLEGNRRFCDGTTLHPHQDAEYRAAVATGQRPSAVLFGCADSRLAAEIIFDRGLGDLFVVRTAGQVIGPEVLATIEYGVIVLGTPLVVVLGHDSCGAIQAAHSVLAGEELPSQGLRAIVDRVTPSITHAHAHDIVDRDRIADVHVLRTIEMILKQSGAIADEVAAGRCDVVGMSYRLAEGRVRVLSGDPAQRAAPVETLTQPA